MNVARNNVHKFGDICLFFVVILSLLPLIWCLDGDDYSHTADPALLPAITDLIYDSIANASEILRPDIEKHLGFGIDDLKSDWDGAFNFSGQRDFLTECIKKTKGDLRQRLCNTAEIIFYFNRSFDEEYKYSSLLRPNKNCNRSSWVSGCESGWGCNANENQKVNLANKDDMPPRTDDCQPCCEGFFCPKGLTCMMPCPLGSYCPLGKLDKSTGTCYPYTYQVPRGNSNHTCGSAAVWADSVGNHDIFCPPGHYCPTTTRKVPCDHGHYCRMGSTSQKTCFLLTSCGPKSSTQSIHAYGVIIIVSLSLALIIFYNCSGQVLTTREKRAAKKREAALREAQKTMKARERWKIAKNVAKKHRLGLQEQLQRTFSCSKSKREQLKIFSQSKKVVMEQPSTEIEMKPSSLTGMKDGIDNDTDNFNTESENKNMKKQAQKNKTLHTQSQIFKYAYGQLEKEKALQQEDTKLTFSGLISMATCNETRNRPVIEIAFKDLTLTLKGKHKNLLRCVTGKLMPGRVSAVMGPSGAGKTTFLMALLGKAPGCTVTGLVLVNGKDEPIQAYKKIIGFVPQDDIVHGDLTVEENLRFSARCRLPANMPKADKVLIIERVIDSLGLQAVRDSLVGTVAKRGISGGQKKRVNVGIEMVIEPSLLILDEPTSGLDSASSQLLLRVLRREALEGVNISMVVHQPSYALFKMFDDLVLLAKGGLTVYHGPVKNIEDYFAGLGIRVPDRVNPPDHFIDVLEGMERPSSVTGEQLPVRWMLHNGYPIPPDMLELLDQMASPTTYSNKSNADSSEQAFGGELLRDKPNAEHKRQFSGSSKDLSQFSGSSKDLSNRVTPGIGPQYRYFLGRVTKQRLREARLQVADYLLLLLAGACVGSLAKMDDLTFGSQGYMFTIIAVSLLCKISALRSFHVDTLEYRRESASGMSSLAYFLSKDTIDLFNTIIKPVVYLSMFFFFNNPRSTFQDNYIVLLCLVYCVTGMAYVIAIYLDPSPAQLWSVLFPVVVTLMASQKKGTFIQVHLARFLYAKWALEAFIIANARRYRGVWLVTRVTQLVKSGYSLHDWHLCLFVLLSMGLASRILAFILLVTRKK